MKGRAWMWSGQKCVGEIVSYAQQTVDVRISGKVSTLPRYGPQIRIISFGPKGERSK